MHPRYPSTWTELFWEERSGFRLRLHSASVAESTLASSSGFALRTVRHDQVSCSHAPTVADLVANAGAPARELLQRLPPVSDVSLPQAIFAPDLLTRIAREAVASSHAVSPRIWRADVSVRQFDQRIRVVNAEGLAVSDRRTVTGMQIEVYARDGKRVRSSLQAFTAVDTPSLVAGGRHKQLAARAAREAVQRLEAIPAPSGEMPVILGPGNPATLFHEACGHGLEADLAAQPGAVYGGKHGQLIASEQVTLIDDPTWPNLPASQTCDDEGTPTAPTMLINRGRLDAYLYDRVTAEREGIRSNGHARRLSAAHAPIPRMSNTYVAGGEYQPEEIIASSPRGILVTRVGAGDTNMMTGDFNVECAEGYLIENGRITAPIRGAMLSGNGHQVLQQIDRVGCDFRMEGNLDMACAKIDQGPLRIACGQPTIRIRSLSVWGG